MAAGMGLVITVVLCVPISFWKAFADERVKNWTPSLVVGLLGGAVLFFFSALLEEFEDPPSSGGRIMAGFCLAIAPILGLAGILAIILILDEHFAEDDLKDEIDRRRPPTEDSP